MTDKRRTTIFPARPRPEAVSKTEATGATQAETPASVASPANASPAKASPNNAPPADLPAIEASANVAPDAQAPASGQANDPAPLRVGLDVRQWQMSGLGSYVRELLAACARLRLPIEWTLIGPPALRDAMPEGIVIARWIDLDLPLYSLRSTLAYPRLGKLDVFHYPHYNLPWWRQRRAVVSVFDLFHMHYGGWLKRRYQLHFLRRLRWGRATVLTASQKTAGELAREIGIPRSRLQVIALGAGGRLASPEANRPAHAAGSTPGFAPGSTPGFAPTAPDTGLVDAPVRSLSGQPLRPPWLLAVGIDQPHKNFDFLLSALGLFFQRRPDSPPLAWVGLSEEALRRRAKSLPASMRDRVALEPSSTPERLERLYAGAMALIFPSLDEGFGLPPLEAMARGVPVICSRREPMIGLLGHAPLYFEPT
jgi:glycosyltransferase involved in cell wall biosynthesis